MEILPFNERILVKPIKVDSFTKSGILVSRDRVDYAFVEVIKTGEGRMLDDGSRVPMTVQKGDKLMVASRAGTELDIAGEIFKMITERDVIGRVAE